MAGRREEEFKATAGRDAGKVFIIREMSAERGERWAIRVLLALTNSGANLPINIDFKSVAGMAKLAEFGIQALAGLKYVEIGDLLDEMMTCVLYKTPGGLPVPLLPGDNCQIEEIATRLALRKGVLQLHTGFFSDVTSLTSPSAPSAAPAG